MTLRQDSIKGSLCCNIFQSLGKKISSEWQHQTSNLISSSLTGLRHRAGPHSPHYLPVFVLFSDTFWFWHLFASRHSITFSSSPSAALRLSHSDTLFSMFTVTSWDSVGSQMQTGQETGAMTRDESPLFMQQKCTWQTRKQVSKTAVSTTGWGEFMSCDEDNPKPTEQCLQNYTAFRASWQNPQTAMSHHQRHDCRCPPTCCCLQLHF